MAEPLQHPEVRTGVVREQHWLDPSAVFLFKRSAQRLVSGGVRDEETALRSLNREGTVSLRDNLAENLEVQCWQCSERRPSCEWLLNCLKDRLHIDDEFESAGRIWPRRASDNDHSTSVDGLPRPREAIGCDL